MLPFNKVPPCLAPRAAVGIVVSRIEGQDPLRRHPNPHTLTKSTSQNAWYLALCSTGGATQHFACVILYRNQVSRDTLKRTSGKKTKRRLARETAVVKEPTGEFDFKKKILHMSWHPQDDIIAVAGNDKLYFYTA